MNGFLIDTNVISEILRAVPNSLVSAWSERQTKQSLFLSVISMGELRKGVTILPQGARRTQLEKVIAEQVPVWFGDRILPVTRSIAERWGVLEGQRQRMGRPLNMPDGIIAATAVEHGLAVATRNGKDFEKLDVSILDPWGNLE